MSIPVPLPLESPLLSGIGAGSWVALATPLSIHNVDVLITLSLAIPRFRTFGLPAYLVLSSLRSADRALTFLVLLGDTAIGLV